MKIKRVHINSKRTEITMLNQNAQDEAPATIEFTFPQIHPVLVQKSLDSLKSSVTTIMNFSEDESERLDVKGISLKYNEKNTGVTISCYLKKDHDSGLGSAFNTPMLYNAHDNVDFALSAETMEAISDVRNVAVNFLKLKFDQQDLFANLKHDEDQVIIEDGKEDPKEQEQSELDLN